MSDQCLTIEDLGELAELPVGDSRRAHLDGCPRCQGLAKSYAAFCAPEDIPPTADLTDANARLSASLDREIGVPAGGEIVRPAAFTQKFLGMRPLVAAAAVLVVALGLSLMRGGPGAPPLEPVLRGAGDEVGTFQGQAVALAGGGYRLSWPAAADDAIYRVVVYGAGLEELGSYEVGAALFLEIQLPVEATFGQVVVLLDGDEVGRSEPVYFGNP